MHEPSRSLLLLALLGAGMLGPTDEGTPPARGLLAELTRVPRLAGTVGSRIGAEIVAGHLREAGFQVEIDEREVLLSHPVAWELGFYERAGEEAPFHRRDARFDAGAEQPGDIPLFNAWTASGVVRGPVVDAGRGLREDFERLAQAGVELRGAIALCAYGGAYRGVKPALASEFGCAGVLLYNRSSESGAERGPVWPEGPWKGGMEAERGSILPIATGPGDPTTPGWPSPAPGAKPPAGKARLQGAALDASLPSIPCLPIGSAQAELLLERLEKRWMPKEGGEQEELAIGPGPVEARLSIDAPRKLRTIRNVIGRLAGASEDCVIAGNHRDSWVRGAHDAGGGTVSLLRAAEHLGARRREGWQPARTILLAFWDAEEQGLIGSTEWVEAHADWLREHCVLYLNADTAVSGTKFGCSGTPGLEAFVRRTLEDVPDPNAPADSGTTLLEGWREAGASPTALGLPGSGSDFTAFLHHLALPILDVGFGGAPASGQYHTAFDDLACVERFIDPGFVGHELAGHFFAAALARAAEEGPALFDASAAARAMAAHARGAHTWLGEEDSGRLSSAFEALAERLAGEAGHSEFYRWFTREGGLPGREWFVLTLWAPGVEKGYGSDSFPLLRSARAEGPEALQRELEGLLSRIATLGGPAGEPRAPAGH